MRLTARTRALIGTGLRFRDHRVSDTAVTCLGRGDVVPAADVSCRARAKCSTSAREAPKDPPFAASCLVQLPFDP